MNKNQDWKQLSKLFYWAKEQAAQSPSGRFPIIPLVKTLKKQGFDITVKLDKSNNIKGVLVDAGGKKVQLEKLIGDSFKWSNLKGFIEYSPSTDALKLQISNNNYQILN